jgi:hypothetical protein
VWGVTEEEEGWIGWWSEIDSSAIGSSVLRSGSESESESVSEFEMPGW